MQPSSLAPPDILNLSKETPKDLSNFARGVRLFGTKYHNKVAQSRLIFEVILIARPRRCQGTILPIVKRD